MAADRSRDKMSRSMLSMFCKGTGKEVRLIALNEHLCTSNLKSIFKKKTILADHIKLMK